METQSNYCPTTRAVVRFSSDRKYFVNYYAFTQGSYISSEAEYLRLRAYGNPILQEY
jgi:hypothetical protein